MRIKMKEAQEQYGSEHSRIYKIMNSQVENKINLKKDHMKLHIPRYFTVKLDNQKQKEGPSAQGEIQIYYGELTIIDNRFFNGSK